MATTKTRHYRKRRTKHTRRKHAKKHQSRRRRTKHLKRRVKRRQTRRRRRRRRMRGGRGSLPSVPHVVGTGVPGGKGCLPIDGRNHYALANPSLHAPNGNIINPSVQLGGGITSILPRGVVDLGRSMGAGVIELYDEWRGQPEYISDDPNVMDQNLQKGNMDNSVVDVPSIYSKSNKLAAAA